MARRSGRDGVDLVDPTNESKPWLPTWTGGGRTVLYQAPKTDNERLDCVFYEAAEVSRAVSLRGWKITGLIEQFVTQAGVGLTYKVTRFYSPNSRAPRSMISFSGYGDVFLTRLSMDDIKVEFLNKMGVVTVSVSGDVWSGWTSK